MEFKTIVESLCIFWIGRYFDKSVDDFELGLVICEKILYVTRILGNSVRIYKFYIFLSP